MGLYAFILAIWCFSSINHLYPLLIDLTTNQLMLMNYGIFTLLIGLAMLVTHQLFQGWATIITVVGYMVTLKGLVLLFFPQWMNQLVVFWQDKSILLAPVPALFLGLLLMYLGFVRKS